MRARSSIAVILLLVLYMYVYIYIYIYMRIEAENIYIYIYIYICCVLVSQNSLLADSQFADGPYPRGWRDILARLEDRVVI